MAAVSFADSLREDQTLSTHMQCVTHRRGRGGEGTVLSVPDVQYRLAMNFDFGLLLTMTMETGPPRRVQFRTVLFPL
jgi:hypothetical protein